MEIITKEQMDELNGLIEKYSNPELVEETVAGGTVFMSKTANVSPLIERRKKLITQEQCEGIVAIATNLLKIMSKVDFVYFLYKNENVFCFDVVYFIKHTTLSNWIKQNEGDTDSIIRAAENKTFFNLDSRIDSIDLEKLATTYTNLTKFCEYIRRRPLTKDDILRNASAKRNN